MTQKHPSLKQSFPWESRFFGAEDAVDAVTMSNASSPRILSVNSVSEDKMPSSLPPMASYSAGVSTSQSTRSETSIVFSLLLSFLFCVITNSFFVIKEPRNVKRGESMAEMNHCQRKHHSSSLHLLIHQTEQSIIITAGDGVIHRTINWRIHRVPLMKQAQWIMAMCIDL